MSRSLKSAVCFYLGVIFFLTVALLVTIASSGAR
jgi:hypothetical protein